MARKNFIKLQHPVTGATTEVQTERQAKILERKGWVRGELPAPVVSDSTELPTTTRADARSPWRNDNEGGE